MATLAVHHLCMGYGKHIVLPDISLSFEKPEIVSIVGANGSGKSTLLRALARLQAPRAGEVLLDGRPIGEYTRREVARKISVLPQSAAAPPDMLAERLVACGRHPHRGYFTEYGAEDRRIIEKVMRETDTWQYRDRFLQELSGGERQRVWLAMALAQEPEILLLDEPTTYLDIRHQLRLMELVREAYQRKRMTVIMVLHDLNQAIAYSHRIIALRQGTIVGDGTPSAVLTAEHIADWFGVRVQCVDIETTGGKQQFHLPLGIADEE